MRGREDDVAYDVRRALEHKMKARQAVGRGDHPAAVAAHGELALRYQLRAMSPTYHVLERKSVERPLPDFGHRTRAAEPSRRSTA